jgi:hypothetical protein
MMTAFLCQGKVGALNPTHGRLRGAVGIASDRSCRSQMDFFRIWRDVSSLLLKSIEKEGIIAKDLLAVIAGPSENECRVVILIEVGKL